MTASRAHQVRELFEAAVELPDAERGAFLEQRCGDDGELRAEVEHLLRYDEVGAAAFLESPAVTLGDVTSLVAVGDVVGGRYRLLDVLGQGGMGTVYLAEQDRPSRRVALKVIHAGLLGRAARRRFSLETELLGRLSHPGIAQIYEAGVHEGDGGSCPFFAMELVEGDTLTRHVTGHALEPRSRLELFAQVCDAVHHAHQKGVIHRDLKPGNILVTDEGTEARRHGGTKGTGRTKVLDFGVARATDPDLAVTTMQTRAGELVGTLPYMSPEQLQGDASDVDIRCDVYALGVILYELLSDALPFDLRNKTTPAALRMLCDEQPTRLGAVSQACRGELETIVGRAMERAPARRYQSASDLGDDVRRSLRDEPILARPPSRGYQLRKFVKRNRPMVVAAIAVTVALLLGLAGTTWGMLDARRQAHRAQQARTREREQRQEAERQAEIAQAVNAFLNFDLLAQADPEREIDREISLRAVVDRAAALIDDRFPDAPAVAGAIHLTLGNTYRGLGELDAAETHLRRAIELSRVELDETDHQVLEARSSLSGVLLYLGRLEEAEAHIVEVLAARRRILGDDDERTHDAINNLAAVRADQGEFDDALALLEETVEFRRRALGAEDRRTQEGLHNLGIMYARAGRHEAAEGLLREHLEVMRRTRPELHPDLLDALEALGVLLARLDRVDEAVPLLEKALAGQRVVLGEGHPGTLETMNNLGARYRHQGRYDEAEALYLRALEQQRRILGENHQQTIATTNDLGLLYYARDRHDEAAPLLESAHQGYAMLVGPDHPYTLVARVNLARNLQAQDELEAARAHFESVVEAAPRSLPPDHWYIASFRGLYGGCLLALGEHEAAEPELLQSVELFSATLGPTHFRTTSTIGTLVELYDGWGRPEEAERWRERLPGEPE